ncbi:CD209 antigen-like protein C [Chanodichthys erythropterus]|uniref:CD209 antigen-like protein C n=1 Tax=Chanodichthys erythropterus TaxID=933992 RepID=UPI00351F7A6E
MPANREGMHNGLIDEPDDDYKSPGVRYSVFENQGKSGQRFFQEPFKVATACLSAFCLILLMILVITSVHNGKSRSSDQDSLPSAAETQMQMGCPNVTALTEELQTVKKEKSELEKERSQLKDKIAKLEATPAPQTSLEPMKSSCPEDWKHFNGSCYYISSFGRTWSDSQSYCKRNGGNLAIILTAEEQTFIWDLLPRGYWNAFWFGISDEKVEDDWHWVDGTKLVGGFWEYGEPNNHRNEDCGYMIKTDVLSRVAIRSWYDAPCHMSLPFICEKTAASS